jgi:hypothetical protein
MALHLNYDGNQANGIIFNTAYPQGAMYNGVALKPVLSVAYDSFMYTEVFPNQLNYIEVAGVKTIMTPEIEAEVQALATAWVQELGAEGNPTLAQAQERKSTEINAAFSADVAAITTASSHEMVSWRKQEDQARAWNLDNTVTTPIIDAILTTRVVAGETKQILVDKIIAAADAYELAYGALLGKSQTLLANVTAATTVADVDLVVW